MLRFLSFLMKKWDQLLLAIIIVLLLLILLLLELYKMLNYLFLLFHQELFTLILCYMLTAIVCVQQCNNHLQVNQRA